MELSQLLEERDRFRQLPPEEQVRQWSSHRAFLGDRLVQCGSKWIAVKKLLAHDWADKTYTVAYRGVSFVPHDGERQASVFVPGGMHGNESEEFAVALRALEVLLKL